MWIIVIFNVLGALMVSLGLPLQANMIWIFTNAALIFHNFRRNDRPQATMFALYWVIAGYGILNLTGVI